MTLITGVITALERLSGSNRGGGGWITPRQIEIHINASGSKRFTSLGKGWEGGEKIWEKELEKRSNLDRHQSREGVAVRLDGGKCQIKEKKRSDNRRRGPEVM